MDKKSFLWEVRLRVGYEDQPLGADDEQDDDSEQVTSAIQAGAPKRRRPEATCVRTRRDF